MSEALWVRIYLLRSVHGAHLRYLEKLILQIKRGVWKNPRNLKLINCVGGGSSALGFWNEFINYKKKQIELIGVEAGGPNNSKLHAAPLTNNSK